VLGLRPKKPGLRSCARSPGSAPGGRSIPRPPRPANERDKLTCFKLRPPQAAPLSRPETGKPFGQGRASRAPPRTSRLSRPWHSHCPIMRHYRTLPWPACGLGFAFT
jgi:hypothetical protein